MTGKSHALIGATVTGAVLVVADYPISAEFGIALLIGIFASLLPDIDSPNALIKRIVSANGQPIVVQTIFGKQIPRNWLLKIPYVLLGLIEFFLRMLLLRPINLISRLIPHRGPTHYLITALALSYGVYWISVLLNQSSMYAVAFASGYVSHLLSDSLTRSGVPLFAPLYRRRIHLLPRRLRLRTNRSLSFGEALSIVLIASGAAYAMLLL